MYLLFVLVSTDINPVLFVLIYIYSGLSTHIYYVVCYHVIAAPCVKSVGCDFALLYTFVDGSGCPWTISSLYSWSVLLRCLITERAATKRQDKTQTCPITFKALRNYDKTIEWYILIWRKCFVFGYIMIPKE